MGSDAIDSPAEKLGHAWLTSCRADVDDAAMAYDEDLANRIRELIAAERDVSETKMFGGLAFLVGGNISVAASGQGGLMVRVDPEATEELVTKSHARPFEMRGRAMQGWLRVDPEGVRSKRQLEPWVRRGVAYARSLPPKREGAKR
jgi:TfoX/Sxy family transcriptional regulator of competence genes